MRNRRPRRVRSKDNRVSSPQHLAQLSGCGSGKHAYPTRNQARARATIVHQRQGKTLFAYKCPSCRLWHLTKHAEFNGMTHVRTVATNGGGSGE